MLQALLDLPAKLAGATGLSTSQFVGGGASNRGFTGLQVLV